MKICLILEGSYPYVHGGVSTWMHNYILNRPDDEFVLWTIAAHKKDEGKFVYDLPSNVIEVHEVFLDEYLLSNDNSSMKRKLIPEEINAIRELIMCKTPDWKVLIKLLSYEDVTPISLLMSSDFLSLITELCREQYPYIAFAQAFYTARSMLLPVLFLLSKGVPEADFYHTISTGYAGLLGAKAKLTTSKPLILTEHGIYSREREEELIRAEWVLPAFKKQWIQFFYMLSDVCYKNANAVTCLFNNAKKIQMSLGVDENKDFVVANGVDYDRFKDVPIKTDNGYTDIGAIIRMAAIKDVKTLIYAFYELSLRVKNVRMHVLGGVDDEEYAQECYALKEALHLDNLLFVGRQNTVEYLEKLDFTILTSISEGQPLSVLESMAARRPAVTTDVGCCKEIIYGIDDKYGQAGYVVPPLDRTGLANAMEKLCNDHELSKKMGMNGQRRVEALFKTEMMMKNYQDVYDFVLKGSDK